MQHTIQTRTIPGDFSGYTGQGLRDLMFRVDAAILPEACPR